MTKITPSYLIWRNGIYYFQTRIPTSFVHDKCKQKLMRRSTRTGNRDEALRIARTWWVDIMSNKRLKTADEMAEEAERENQLYIRGGILQAELDAIHPRDDESRSALLSRIALSSFDREALDVFGEEQVRERELAAQKAQMLLDAAPKAPLAANANASVNNNTHRLSDLVEMYMNGRLDSARKRAPSTEKQTRQRLELLVEMLGNVRSNGLTLDLLTNKYVNRIVKLPSVDMRCKKYRDSKGNILPVDERIAIAEQDDDEKFSIKTAKEHAGSVKKFLKWASAPGRDYLFKEWPLAFEDFDQIPSAAKYKRMPFTAEDLKKIFENDDFRNGNLMETPELHWAPFISAYMALRVGEIAKLYVEDIIYSAAAETWIMKIVHENETRRAKTPSSIRDIPVHDVLIDLGFINFVEQQRKKGERQLFPALKPNEDGEWGGEIASWFNDDGYLKKCGVQVCIKGSGSEPEKRKSFHSFRHSFIDQGKQARLDDLVRREITGHSTKQGAHSDYEQEFIMKTRKEYMKKVAYDIDISVIKKWPKN